MTHNVNQPGWIITAMATATLTVGALTACVAQQQTQPSAVSSTTAPAAAPAAAPAPADADIAALPPPTRVTLRCRAAPAKQALLDLFRQADLPTDSLEPMLDESVGGLTVTADLVDVPFLLALLELCRQCHLEPHDTPSPNQRIGLTRRRPSTRPATQSTRPTTRPFAATRPVTQPRRPAPWRGFAGMTSRPSNRPMPATTSTTTRPSWVDNPLVVRGPFVFVARSATRTSQLWLEQEKAQPSQRMELSIQMLVDPKLRIFEMTRQMEVELAQDENGRSLAPPRQGGGNFAPSADRTDDSRGWTFSVSVPLAYPPAGSRRLALLRGRIRAAAVTRTAVVEINDFAKPPGERRAGDIRFTFGQPQPPQRPGEGFMVPVTVHRDGRDDAAWREVSDLARDRGAIRATDDAGRAMSVHLQSFRPADNDQVVRGDMELRSEPRPGEKPRNRAPARLVWDVPVEVQDLIIPVEFKDLELP